MARKKYGLVGGSSATKVMDLSPKQAKPKREKAADPVVAPEPEAAAETVVETVAETVPNPVED